MNKWTFTGMIIFLIILGGCKGGGADTSDPLPSTVTLMLTAKDPGEVKVTLPLYPGAKASNQPFDMPFALVPSSPYLRSAKAQYLLPVSVADAQAWYREHLPKEGFKETGQATAGKDGSTTYGIEFTSQAEPDLKVDLSFQEEKQQRTLVQYWVTFIATPPRPPESLLPADTVRIEVTQLSGPAQPDSRQTVSDVGRISQLVEAVNRLSPDTRGAHSCRDELREAELGFVTPQGQTVVVHVRPACSSVRVGQTELWDRDLEVWDLVREIR